MSMGVSEHKQRLVAILAADAAGYSSLMALDEQATVDALDSARSVFRANIEANGGRVVDMAGDSVLAVFETAAGAVRVALQVQQALEALNAGVPTDRSMRFRIGVHLGDVIEKSDGSVYGEGVNVAARLQAIAEPGGLTVSDAVRGSVRQRIQASFQDLGEQQVKNIAEPVRSYRVRPAQGIGASTQPTRWVRPRSARWALASLIVSGFVGIAIWSWPQRWLATTALPLAIAFLPLTTPDSDPESALLGDTIAKDLRVAVGRSIRYVPVVTAGRGDAYGEKSPDLRARARDLRARYLVEGDARRDAAGVTVTLQLIDGETATQAWSTQVSLPAADVAGDSSRLIKRLTWRLRHAVRNAEMTRAASERGARDDPADLVSRGQAMWGGERASMLQARKLFDAALRIDSNHVPALIARAWTLNHEFEDDPKSDRQRIVREMDDLARRAISLDSDNAAAWNLLATALGWQGRYDSALEASKRAIGLDPANKDSLINRGWIMDVSGQAQNTAQLLEQSREIDPVVDSYEMNIACEANVLLGRFQDAAQACAKAAALEDWTQNQVWLIAALAHLDDQLTLDAAKRELARKQPGFTIGGFRSQHRSRHPVYVRQSEDNLFAGLRKAGLPE
ncbi:MAG: adenylate/guanylate cyclase domain-containing protein [Burkholderiaceae bacterium]